MAEFGFTLYCEGFGPRELVKRAVMAEEAGFDYLAISDHYHPWLDNQTHAGFAWSILGALAQATSRIKLVTFVTCPIIRYHPAIVAQMAATVGVLSEGRFTLGLGTGERLNEHVVGQGWPPISERQKMIREAVQVIRELWKGGYVMHKGEYYTVEEARVFDLPKEPIKIVMAAGGPGSARIAADIADGLGNTTPDEKVLKAYLESGGKKSEIWGQQVLSWAPDVKTGQENAHKQFRFSTGGWKTQAELPNPENFSAAAEPVDPEDLSGKIPSGPDVNEHVKSVKEFLDAGYTRQSFLYPGDDPEGFITFWKDHLQPALNGL
jgi:G6PDH family F420-dependent oxidoreductase